MDVGGGGCVEFFFAVTPVGAAAGVRCAGVEEPVCG